MLKRGFQFAPGYRLQEFLGRGQFGQVWRATAPGGAAAAVKFIDLSDGQGQKEYDGVRRVKQIRHANLMPITAIWLLDAQGKVIEEAPDEAIETIDLSVVEAKGQSAVYRPPDVDPNWLVVAMLLGGKSLQQRLRECINEGLPGIPPKELISYMDESAKGIDFLNAPQHDLGEGPIAIQHSDIKPANIVLIGSSAVVCDFGLARILTRNQITATSAAGTPAYMAPEAISGKPSRTSDQYSLAVTYYHLRTNSLPVSDGSLWEVLDAHRQGKLKLGLIPQAEQDVLRKATSLDWENRFESNVEMVDALREALRSEGFTKPSFVANRDGHPPVSPSADTRAMQGDPTATLDLPSSDVPASNFTGSALSSSVVSSSGVSAVESLPATEALVQADKSTPQHLLKETLPALDAAQGASAADSNTLAGSIKRNQKMIAGFALAAVVLATLGGMAFRPAAPNQIPATDSGITGPENKGTIDGQRGVEVVGERVVSADPLVLAREAAALIDSDQPQAIAKFEEALKLDPGLLPEKRELPGHKGSIMRMLETPDGSHLVTMADGPAPFLWNLSSAQDKPILLAGHQKLINGFAISNDGQRLLTASLDDTARVWNLLARDVAASSLELKGHTGSVEAVAWHPTRPIAVTASSDLTLGIWEIGLATEQEANGTITKQRLIPIRETLTSLASDLNGEWLAARTIGADLVEPNVDILVFPWQELTDVAGAQPPIRLDAKNAKVFAFLAGGDGSLLVTGDAGGTLSLYSVADKKLAFPRTEAHQSDVEAIRVVQVGQRDVIVSGAQDGSVHWWKYGGTSETVGRNFSAQGISCVDVSADGRWVAAGANDGSVWLWDTSAEKGLGAIQFASGASSVDSVVIDVTTDWLIAGCADGVVRMWDLNFAKLMALTRPTPPEATIQGPTVEVKSPQLSMR